MTLYGSVHQWLWQRRHLKKKCKHCGSTKHLNWALKKGCKHAHSIGHYLVLCDSCHKKYDMTPKRRAQLKKLMTGRKITWIPNPNRNAKGQFTTYD
jgi:phage terminase large subunit GpA-like protein